MQKATLTTLSTKLDTTFVDEVFAMQGDYIDEVLSKIKSRDEHTLDQIMDMIAQFPSLNDYFDELVHSARYPLVSDLFKTKMDDAKNGIHATIKVAMACENLMECITADDVKQAFRMCQDKKKHKQLSLTAASVEMLQETDCVSLH